MTYRSLYVQRGMRWRVLAALTISGSLSGCFVYDEGLLEGALVGSSGASSTGGSLEPVTGGSGGLVATGGTGGGGGEPESTGGGPGGAPPNTGGTGGGPTFRFDFESDLQGFLVSFDSTTGPSDSAASWDGAEGDPEQGSASLFVDAGGADESMFFTRTLGSPVDLSGGTITARVKLDSGLSGNPLCPGGAYVLAKSGATYVFARGAWRNLAVIDGWATISMSADSPDWTSGSFDSSDVRELGVGFATGGPGCSAPDWKSGQAHLDSIDY